MCRALRPMSPNHAFDSDAPCPSRPLRGKGPAGPRRAGYLKRYALSGRIQVYFWKTRLLVDELAKGPLEERTLQRYYLATAVFVSVCYYIGSLAPRDNLYALAVEAFGVLVATIVGLNAAFAANGGSSGTRFLEKVVSISFPLLMRVLAAAIAPGLVVAVLEAAELTTIQGEWFTSIEIVAFQVVFFLRLVAHVRKTNA